jgi:hypothetical protein
MNMHRFLWRAFAILVWIAFAVWLLVEVVLTFNLVSAFEWRPK